MSVKVIDQEIVHLYSQLSEKHKKIILSVVKAFAAMNQQRMVEKTNTWANYKAFEDDMHERFEDLKTGSIQSVTLSELEAGARDAFKRRKHKSS